MLPSDKPYLKSRNYHDNTDIQTPNSSTCSTGVTNDDGLTVHFQLIFHKWKPNRPSRCHRIWHISKSAAETIKLIQPIRKTIL